MDRSKLAAIGERLKSGGAQMGRMVSLKMREVKEMLQAPTPESKIVDQATSPTMESPDWGLNLRICAMINSEELSGTEVVRAVKRKISAGEVHSQRLGLELLETCAMNCEKVFSEIASEKLLEEMVTLIENPQSERECSVRAMEMIRAWGESDDLIYLPVFRQTYENLKQNGTPSRVQDGTFPSTQYSLESYTDGDSLSPPPSYPDTELNGDSGTVFPYNYGSLSVEGKKEFLEITRNSLEVLVSIVNSAPGSEPSLPKDELTMSMLDKCKDSQTVLQRIIETTTEHETMLFEALSLHDELQQVVSKFSSLDVSELSVAQLPQESPKVSKPSEAQLPLENLEVSESQIHQESLESSETSVVQLPQESRPANLDLESQIQTRNGNEQPGSPKAESKANSDLPNLL
ncbi:hypothetical protein V2J09_022142 [Rumex salicifolius]